MVGTTRRSIDTAGPCSTDRARLGGTCRDGGGDHRDRDCDVGIGGRDALVRHGDEGHGRVGGDRRPCRDARRHHVRHSDERPARRWFRRAVPRRPGHVRRPVVRHLLRRSRHLRGHRPDERLGRHRRRGRGRSVDQPVQLRLGVRLHRAAVGHRCRRRRRLRVLHRDRERRRLRRRGAVGQRRSVRVRRGRRLVAADRRLHGRVPDRVPRRQPAADPDAGLVPVHRS